MTDRVKGFTVTLKEDIREDDFQDVIKAVELIKGVIHVEPLLVTVDDHVVKQRIKLKMIQKILKMLNDD